ncbi:hypothetical protein C8R47DRAFT_960036 [Mycena vitilis]|nr:hypothetical protein C8R47DRAFT_996980 [Mycena vitilis]KAJ6517955.1 hypothetical protein C8R47DRAFT_960036 [Mycena vitilis]
MGGLIDLTLLKTHPNHQLPRHARWLLPHLLGRHRVPLYFYYGQVFPLKEPVPDALIEKGFVPDADEISYLRNVPGDVAFSPWSLKSSVWKSRRDGAPSSPSSSHAAQTYQHSETLADSPVPVKSFPAVERGSGQKAGEDIHAFMERRRLHNAKRTQLESSQARTSRLAKEQHASKGAPPGKKGACVFIWEEEDGGFFIRRACNRQDAADRWDEFTPNQRVYDSFSNQWDLCTALAPTEDAEPDNQYDDYYDDDDDFLLERAYDLDREHVDEDADHLAGWRKQEVKSTLTLRFGFNEPAAAPIFSPQQMESKQCGWIVGDTAWAVPDDDPSPLRIFLRHLLDGDLKGFQAELCDLTLQDSDLQLDWNVDVEIFGHREGKTIYSIRPHGSEASGPSILLDSAATALQIVRSGWGDSLAHLIRNLVELGAEFYPSWQRPVHRASLAAPSTSTLGRRPPGYKPTHIDHGVYVQQRDAFLRSPRGRAALFYGGVVGRLARLAIQDFEDVACLDPSEDILEAGAHVSSANGEEARWHEALTDKEIHLICGVYLVETGTFI